MTDYINLKPHEIKVPDAIPSSGLFPLAICCRQDGGDWRLYAVAKGRSDGCEIMFHYLRMMENCFWVLVDRRSGMVVESWPKIA